MIERKKKHDRKEKRSMIERKKDLAFLSSINLVNILYINPWCCHHSTIYNCYCIKMSQHACPFINNHWFSTPFIEHPWLGNPISDITYADRRRPANLLKTCKPVLCEICSHIFAMFRIFCTLHRINLQMNMIKP